MNVAAQLKRRIYEFKSKKDNIKINEEYQFKCDVRKAL